MVLIETRKTNAKVKMRLSGDEFECSPGKQMCSAFQKTKYSEVVEC